MKFFGSRTETLVLAVGALLALSLGIQAQQATPPALTGQQQSSATVSEQKQKGDGQEVDPLNRPLSDKQRLQRRNALKGEIKGAYKTWLDQDATYIISDE